MIFMAEISEEQARKILEENGYTVLDYLGGGAASHAFKASRKSKKDPTKEKEMAAKVCAPQGNSWASLNEGLEEAEELKKLKKDFKSKLEKAKREGQGELVKGYEKN